ncbi:uncharacterized protein CANTADRAFT_92506 [Suhomyces tanzawaensis NRRL Y-17324]|uniref:Uncharacterized protein n=1 Tax=Suhomyces tanzawaensis NRRL Y-17324 TaxID=984487 RepID=A0A1E4SAW4_9ASCO|nr:uncharacterized protein CANTADRAFT_92506 [Suhomyces tanzawaensis NRRL Y-17324]ODV76618.1 hypothetical protein CANTADRAFT_92506 [Suhomyces tanzawaensis NRRL Y-17324]
MLGATRASVSVNGSRAFDWLPSREAPLIVCLQISVHACTLACVCHVIHAIPSVFAPIRFCSESLANVAVSSLLATFQNPPLLIVPQHTFFPRAGPSNVSSVSRVSSYTLLYGGCMAQRASPPHPGVLYALSNVLPCIMNGCSPDGGNPVKVGDLGHFVRNNRVQTLIRSFSG